MNCLSVTGIKTKEEKQYRRILIATFMILYASTSYYCKNCLSETVNTMISGIGVLLVCHRGKGTCGKRIALFIIVILAALGVLSSLLAGDELKLMIYPLINFGLAVLFIFSVNFEKFCCAYKDILYFVSFFSIIVYFIYSFMPSLIEMFPIVISSSQSVAYNLFFAVVSPHALNRIQGFFWEPGAYQTFLNIAIFFEIMSPKASKKRLLVMYIGIILSFSTTGYIVALINMMILLVKSKIHESSKIAKLVVIATLGIVMLYVLYPIVPKTINGISFGFEKIERFLQAGKNSVGTNYDSSSVRYDSIVYPLDLFVHNPLFGAGYAGLWGLSEIMNHSMVTCTPINYFAMYGIFYGILIMLSIYAIGKYFTKSIIIKVMFFCVFLLSMISEHYVNYLMIDIFVAYGACRIIERKCSYTELE